MHGDIQIIAKIVSIINDYYFLVHLDLITHERLIKIRYYLFVAALCPIQTHFFQLEKIFQL